MAICFLHSTRTPRAFSSRFVSQHMQAYLRLTTEPVRVVDGSFPPGAAPPLPEPLLLLAEALLFLEEEVAVSYAEIRRSPRKSSFDILDLVMIGSRILRLVR